MKKLLVLVFGLMLLSAPLLSAHQYEFNETDKELVDNTYQSLYSFDINPINFLNNLNVLIERLYKWKHNAMDWKEKYKNKGSGSSSSCSCPDYSQGDMNGDCNVDLGDLARAGDIVGKVKSNYGKTVC